MHKFRHYVYKKEDKRVRAISARPENDLMMMGVGEYKIWWPFLMTQLVAGEAVDNAADHPVDNNLVAGGQQLKGRSGGKLWPGKDHQGPNFDSQAGSSKCHGS